MERKKIVRKLLENFHLNVIDRNIFRETPLSELEVKDEIAEILKTNNFFPNRWKSWNKDEFNYDGYVLERVYADTFFVHFQISGATMNLLESKTYSFNSIESAIDFYIKNEIRNDIDGVKIEFASA